MSRGRLKREHVTDFVARLTTEQAEIQPTKETAQLLGNIRSTISMCLGLLNTIDNRTLGEADPKTEARNRLREAAKGGADAGTKSE